MGVRSSSRFSKAPELILAVLMLAGLVIFLEGCGSSNDEGSSANFSANTTEVIHPPTVRGELTTFSGKVSEGMAILSFSGKFGALISPTDLSGDKITVEISQGSTKISNDFTIIKNDSGQLGYNIDSNNLAVTVMSFPGTSTAEPVTFRLIYKEIEISNGAFYLLN
jgi:hypothetical protein